MFLMPYGAHWRVILPSSADVFDRELMKEIFKELQATSVATKGVRVVGYCFGGRYAIRHASRDCIAAAAFHPV